MIKISNRLKTIFSKIAPYHKFCDVGCDHGYLEILALEDPNYYCLAIDNKNGPIESCKKNVMQYAKHKDNISYSLSDGLDALTDDYSCVTICGMGTELICDIISKNIAKTKYIERFIIDSHRNVSELRKFVTSIGYEIIDEQLVYENGIYYEIITFDKAKKEISYTEEQYLFGPCLLNNKTKEFYKKYQEMLDNKKNIIAKIKDESNSKFISLSKEIELIERVIKDERI